MGRKLWRRTGIISTAPNFQELKLENVRAALPYFGGGLINEMLGYSRLQTVAKRAFFRQ